MSPVIPFSVPTLSIPLLSKKFIRESHRKSHRASRRNRTVQIVNPTTEGSHFTTRRQALELERRGRAVIITETGEVSPLGLHLFLLDVSLLDTAAARQALLDFASDESITRDRKGIFFWNGADHSRNAAHGPFENVVLAKPGRVGTLAWVHQSRSLNPMPARLTTATSPKSIQSEQLTHASA